MQIGSSSDETRAIDSDPFRKGEQSGFGHELKTDGVRFMLGTLLRIRFRPSKAVGLRKLDVIV